MPLCRMELVEWKLILFAKHTLLISVKRYSGLYVAFMQVKFFNCVMNYVFPAF